MFSLSKFCNNNTQSECHNRADHPPLYLLASAESCDQNKCSSLRLPRRRPLLSGRAAVNPAERWEDVGSAAERPCLPPRTGGGEARGAGPQLLGEWINQIITPQGGYRQLGTEREVEGLP